MYEIFLFLLFCLTQDFFEESCLFFILIWLLSDFLTRLKNYFKIQVIWPFFGPKREIFLFFDLYEISLFLLFCLIQDFFEESCLFFILIWLLSDFLTCLKNYFIIQLISSFFGPKREIFDFFDLYEIYLFLLFCLKVVYFSF